MIRVVIVLLALCGMSWVFFFKKKWIAILSEKTLDKREISRLLEDDEFNYNCNLAGTLAMAFVLFAIYKVILPTIAM